MADRPLVSIGLPTYNRAHVLRRAIASALEQDYANLELIISDNASTDETERICRELSGQDQRIRYFRQPINRGATANFNEVLRQARGEFFLWLSDDDWLDAAYVSQCVQVLEAQPDYALVSGTMKYLRADTFSIEADTDFLQDSGQARVLAYFRQVRYNGVFYGVMRRAQAAAVPLQDVLGTDWFFVASLAFMGKVRVLPDVFTNRASTGISKNLVELALSYGLPPRRARHPVLIIAANAFKDISAISPAYKSLSKLARLALAVKAAQTICAANSAFSWGLRTRLRRVWQSLRQAT